MKISETRVYITPSNALQVVPAGNKVARNGRYPSLSTTYTGGHAVLEWTPGQSKDNSGKSPLGERVKFSDLPMGVQRTLKRRLMKLK